MYQSFQNGDFTEPRFYKCLLGLIDLKALSKVINKHTDYIMVDARDLEITIGNTINSLPSPNYIELAKVFRKFREQLNETCNH